MKKTLSRSAITFAISASLFVTACSEPATTNHLMQQSTELTIRSIDDLNGLFNKQDYKADNWNKSDRQIPRITFEGSSIHWAESSAQLPVDTKKTIFFRLMAPLSLVANENILLERGFVTTADLDDSELINIAIKYRVIKDNNEKLTEQLRATLLSRVDIIPASLALAQSAEESGWGTSRFAVEGNAFFGQWDFSGNGMKPKKQREELGNYGVARFDTPLDSVEAYMLNINTNAAYEKLRTFRAQLRLENKLISGYQLATTLDKYSERGQAYIDGIQKMIRYNELQGVDSLTLSNTKLIHLVTERR